jgi:hypothetical protein
MLKNARELWNMGMKAAALALFCTDDNNRMALEITGFVCPQTQRAQQLASQAESARVAAAKLEAERRQRFAAQGQRASPTVPPALPLELAPPLPAVVAQPDPEPRPLASASSVGAAPAVASALPATARAAETPQPVAAVQPAAVQLPPPVPVPDGAPQNPVIVRVVSDPAR